MNKKLAVLFSFAVLLVLPVVVFAAPIDPLTWFRTIIDNLLDLVVWPIFIGAIIIMLIWAGFLFITAAGDPSKITNAKKAFIWAVIGIVVGILAFSAYTFIGKILGVLGPIS